MKKQIQVWTVLALFIGFLLQSCGFGGELIWIDNPTDKAISIEIDGKKYDLAPGELKRVADATSGKQMFKGIDGKEVEIEINGVSMINCTNSTYIDCGIAYTDNPNSQNEQPAPVEIELEGVKYKGNFKLYTDIVIPHGDINYNVLETFPDEINTAATNPVLHKMYRAKDFLKDPDMQSFKN